MTSQLLLRSVNRKVIKRMHTLGRNCMLCGWSRRDEVVHNGGGESYLTLPEAASNMLLYSLSALSISSSHCMARGRISTSSKFAAETRSRGSMSMHDWTMVANSGELTPVPSTALTVVESTRTEPSSAPISSAVSGAPDGGIEEGE